MSDSVLRGKVYVPGDGAGQVCDVRVDGFDLVLVVAVPASDGPGAEAAPTEIRLRLDELTLAPAGDGFTKLVARYEGSAGKHTLYLDRVEGLAYLRAHGGSSLHAKLDGVDEALRAARSSGAALWISLGVGCLALLWGALFVLDLGVGWAMHRVPPSWEVSLGQTLSEAIAPKDKRVTDPVVRAGVEAIWKRLLDHAEVGEYEFEIHVVEDETMNAFALPGGQVAVLTGLLEKAESPEEVAGVLAHEVQHVLRRHSLRQILDTIKVRLLLTLLVGDLDTLSDVVLAKASGLIELAHSRDAEREADQLGMRLLERARVDPRGMIRFFEKLKDEHGELVDKLAILTTHPGGSERVETLTALAAELDTTNQEPIDVDWPAFQAALKEATE